MLGPHLPFKQDKLCCVELDHRKTKLVSFQHVDKSFDDCFRARLAAIYPKWW